MRSLNFVLYIYLTIYCCYSAPSNERPDAQRPAPNAETGKMFAVPTQLKENDEIIITGSMTDGMLDIALRPDGNEYNIISQISVAYPVNQPLNEITLKNVVNGADNIIGQFRAVDYFYDTSFDVRIIITSNALRISIGETFLHIMPLEHNKDDIRLISVTGQVKEITFRFGETGV